MHSYIPTYIRTFIHAHVENLNTIQSGTKADEECVKAPNLHRIQDMTDAQRTFEPLGNEQVPMPAALLFNI